MGKEIIADKKYEQNPVINGLFKIEWNGT